jgi:CubicO group peptidase (beta-lactamase class C family)
MLRYLLALALVWTGPAAAQPLSSGETAAVDALVTKTLRETGVPSASISIVRGGEIVLVKAYGKASETIPVARGDLPYQIASISKQFTAMGLLLLEDEGKLDLDDKVAKWLPGVSGGDTINIRQLLSHTAGLRDYWPQDYMFRTMATPVRPGGIVDRWGKKGLDFAPGSDWQYSNTGYIVAGMILEKAAGEPLMRFLRRRVFDPVGIAPFDQDDTFTPAFPSGYSRHALGPVRLSPVPARGWMFATGMLSMTAGDLAKWNLARLNRRILAADNWTEQEQPVIRRDGTTNGYGLGIYQTLVRSRRVLSHTGGAVGFFSRNSVYPDSRAAITVLTNADFSDTTTRLTTGIEEIVLGSAPAPTAETPRVDDVKQLYATLVAGAPDRAKMTANLNYYFDRRTVDDFRSSLGALGEPSIELAGAPRLRGGFVGRSFSLKFPNGRTLNLSTYAEPGRSGRWEQFLISE